jgi:hypothetical protein
MHISSMLVQRSLMRLVGRGPFIWLTAPGTVVHELGHALFCPIFGHSIQQIRLFQPGADGVLGFVKHAYNPRNPWAILGNFFISTGPIWLGGAVLIGILAVLGADLSTLEPKAAGHFFLQLPWREPATWLLGYLFLCVGSQLGMSLPDIKGSMGGFALLLLLWTGAGFASLRFGLGMAEYLVVAEKYAVLFATVLLPVFALNLAVAGLVGMFAKLLSR